MLKVQLIFNGKYFMVRNFNRLKFMRIGCLQTFGEKVAWSDAVWQANLSHNLQDATACLQGAFRKAKNSLEFQKQPFVAVTEYSGQETWTEFCPTIRFLAI